MNKPRLLLSLISVALLSSTASADPIEKMGWKKSRNLDDPKKVVQKTGSQKPIAMLTLAQPEVTEQNHAVGGEIRYNDVAGDGFVEMWTHYKDGAHYFSRTLGSSGPMAKLSGNSEWRPFLLPFFSDGKALPSKLQINLVLPGGGTVEFRNVTLYQLPGDRTGSAQAGWWSVETGTKIGAIGGTLIGVLAAIGGILSSLGKGRGFSMTLCLSFFIIGGLSLILGIAALVSGQPYEVWFPALLMGGLLLLLGGILYPVLRKVYLNHELRTISAAG